MRCDCGYLSLIILCVFQLNFIELLHTPVVTGNLLFYSPKFVYFRFNIVLFVDSTLFNSIQFVIIFYIRSIWIVHTELLRHRRVDCLRWIQTAQDDNENLWCGICEYCENIEHANVHTKKWFFRTERSTESTDDEHNLDTQYFATIFIMEILSIFYENEQLLSSSTVMYETLTHTFSLSLSMRLRSQFQSNTRNYQQKKFHK